MSEPYIGEIRMFGGTFAPAGWAMCQGQLMPISENDALFTLLGTTYGGDGQETFGIPDLQGRIPIHAGQGPGLSQNYQLGERAGVESVTLTVQQVPIHSHAPLASTGSGTQNAPGQGTWAASPARQFLAGGTLDGQLNSAVVNGVGGSQPHENMQPYLVVGFIISLFGIFPQQN